MNSLDVLSVVGVTVGGLALGVLIGMGLLWCVVRFVEWLMP